MDKRLCSHPLSYDEALQLELRIAPLIEYLGAPGDWGYGTQLGDITLLLLRLHNQVRDAKDLAAKTHGVQS